MRIKRDAGESINADDAIKAIRNEDEPFGGPAATEAKYQHLSIFAYTHDLGSLWERSGGDKANRRANRYGRFNGVVCGEMVFNQVNRQQTVAVADEANQSHSMTAIEGAIVSCSRRRNSGRRSVAGGSPSS